MLTYESKLFKYKNYVTKLDNHGDKFSYLKLKFVFNKSRTEMYSYIRKFDLHRSLVKGTVSII